MVGHFSPDVVSKIFTPSYPATSPNAAQNPIRVKVDAQLLGGRGLRTCMRKFEPDIVFSDNPLYAAQVGLLSVSFRKRIPLVLHLRGDWWREYLAWFSSASLAKRLRGIQQYSYGWAGFLLSGKITPICRWLESIVHHYLPLKRTEVVYQGVDSKEFFPESGYEFKRPAAAIIQNHTILPKVLGLLQFRPVVERLQDVHFYITEGERAHQTYFRLVREHFSGLTNAHFVSGVNGSIAVRRMLTASDCYVLPSGLDCCPTTVLEASLMERPVIASKIGGIPELIKEGGTGWTVENGATSTWVDRISSVLTDPKLNRRIGRNGRKWVARNFDWAVIARQVERIVRDEAS